MPRSRLSAPDFQQDLISPRLPAKSDRVVETAHQLAVDFQNNVTALQSGVGGIGGLLDILAERTLNAGGTPSCRRTDRSKSATMTPLRASITALPDPASFVHRRFEPVSGTMR